MTEDELLNGIVEAALLFGWQVHHDRRSDQAKQQGTAGFPDLCMARDGRVIFAELKSAKGSTTYDQLAWAFALEGRPGGQPGKGLEFYLWRPADYDEAIKVLR